MDRRQYPRVCANIPAVITISDGTKVNVVVSDTSSSGLRIQCGSRERELVSPRGNCVSRGQPIEVSIEMTLSSGTAQTVRKSDAVCTLVFSRRTAQNVYQIGMNYREIDSHSYACLGEFIDARLNPKST